MDATSLTLLERVGKGEPDAWARLDGVYRPFLLRWFKSQGVGSRDAEDLTQEVMLVLSKEIDRFIHSGRDGAFRTWLRGVCLNRVMGYRRSQKLRGKPVGGTEFHLRLQDMKDSGDDLSSDWDREHDQAVLRHALQNIAGEFEQQTLQVFSRLALDGVPAAQVAKEHGMSVGAVYIVKSRVLRRLRSEAAALIEIDG